MIDCEKAFSFLRKSVMFRMKRSVPPPGEDCATNSIVLDGYACACAGAATTTAQTVPMSNEPIRVQTRMLFMISSVVWCVYLPVSVVSVRRFSGQRLLQSHVFIHAQLLGP